MVNSGPGWSAIQRPDEPVWRNPATPTELTPATPSDPTNEAAAQKAALEEINHAQSVVVYRVLNGVGAFFAAYMLVARLVQLRQDARLADAFAGSRGVEVLTPWPYVELAGLVILILVNWLLVAGSGWASQSRRYTTFRLSVFAVTLLAYPAYVFLDVLTDPVGF